MVNLLKSTGMQEGNRISKSIPLFPTTGENFARCKLQEDNRLTHAITLSKRFYGPENVNGWNKVKGFHKKILSLKQIRDELLNLSRLNRKKDLTCSYIVEGLRYKFLKLGLGLLTSRRPTKWGLMPYMLKAINIQIENTIFTMNAN